MGIRIIGCVDIKASELLPSDTFRYKSDYYVVTKPSVFFEEQEEDDEDSTTANKDMLCVNIETGEFLLMSHIKNINIQKVDLVLTENTNV